MARRHLAGQTRAMSPFRENDDSGRRSPQPSNPNRHKTTAWHDVLDICKKGFATKMDVMGEEILQDVRVEVQQASTALRKEMTELLETREKAMSHKMSQLLDKMDAVMQSTEGAGSLNFYSILDEIRNSSSARAENEQKLSHSMEEQMAKLTEQLQKMEGHDGDRECRLSEKLKITEDHLQQLLDIQCSLRATSSDISQEMRRMSQQISRGQTDLESSMENQMVQYLKSPTSLTKVDLQKVVDQVSRTENVVNIDFQLILQEIAKIQKGLHMEFVSITNKQEAIQDRPSVAGQSSTDNPDRVLAFQDEPDAADDIHQASDGPKDGETETAKVSHAPSSKTELGLKVKKRVREFWTQTDIKELKDYGSQTDPKIMEKKAKKTVGAKPKKEEPPAASKPVFADAEAMKAKARMALVKPQYNVFDQYHTEGYAQRIARSTVFENVTLAVVCFNALWMAVDTDLNPAALILDAHPVFQVAENLFCTFFTIELGIRFGAFKEKKKCFRDGWFVFDLILVSMMLIETWIVPFVVVVGNFEEAMSGLNTSSFRMARMVKILRLSRMAKLLRAIPELSIIVKGIGFAARSVLVFFLLWMMIIFVFGIVLRQLTMGQDFGSEYFSSVPESFNTLLMHGILPEQAPLLADAMAADPGIWMIIMCFVLLASMTIMYMLVGVLVEVMSVISSTEKEGLTVSFVASQLRESLENLSYNTEVSLSQEEFRKLLVQPDIVRVIGGVGVDVGVLMDMLDVIYEDLEKKQIQGLSFESMVDLVLNLRGANTATVKDVKELMRVMKALIKDSIHTVHKKLADEFHAIRMDLHSLREEAMDNRDDYHHLNEAGGEHDEDSDEEHALS